MKIVFFGTSEKSLPILNSLNSNFDLVLCVTKTDQRVGRKQELKECAVKTWAKNKNIDFVEINNLRDSDLKKVLTALRGKKVEYTWNFSYRHPWTCSIYELTFSWS